MSKNTNGKGDKPRNCFSKQYKDNFEKITWKKIEIAEVDKEKMAKYENHIDELIACLLGEKDPIYLITNESTVGDFLVCEKKTPARLKKLIKKYNLGVIEGNDGIIDTAEKMYNFRPF